jgi:hypothetical protein
MDSQRLTELEHVEEPFLRKNEEMAHAMSSNQVQGKV